jgi:hypothetical protein
MFNELIDRNNFFQGLSHALGMDSLSTAISCVMAILTVMTSPMKATVVRFLSASCCYSVKFIVLGQEKIIVGFRSPDRP